MPAPKLIHLTPAERGEMIQRIRFELGIRRGRKLTLAEFGDLVSGVAGLGRSISHATVIGWEKGAEPGFLAGCAIAHLGGLPAEALAFRQAGGDSRPASEAYGPPPTAPLKRVAELRSFPPLKGRPITPAPAKKRGKSA